MQVGQQLVNLRDRKRSELEKEGWLWARSEAGSVEGGEADKKGAE